MRMCGAKLLGWLLWFWLVACLAAWLGLAIVWFNSVDLREVGTRENLRTLNGRRGFVWGYYFLGTENVMLQSRPTQNQQVDGHEYPVLWVDHDDPLYDTPKIIWPVLRVLFPDENQGLCLFYGTITTDGQFGHFGMSENELTRAMCIWRPINYVLLLILTAIPMCLIVSRRVKSSIHADLLSDRKPVGETRLRK